MEMCEREGLHQIDLLSPAPEEITEAEFQDKAHGQNKMDRISKKNVLEIIRSQKLTLQHLKGRCKELDTVSYNTDVILTRHAMETEQIPRGLDNSS